MKIEVCQPNPEHRSAIKNLCVFHRYDLMPFIEDGDGSDVNRFGVIGDLDATNHDRAIAEQDAWWTKPGVLLPILIKVEDLPGGFALVARPPHAHASVDFRMEDFFVVNKCRRAGVGRSAVAEIFACYPGRWELGWLPKNKPAQAFWWSVTSGHQPEEWVVEQAPGTRGLPGIRMAVR